MRLLQTLVRLGSREVTKYILKLNLRAGQADMSEEKELCQLNSSLPLSFLPCLFILLDL
jgi:hypothetical protein